MNKIAAGLGILLAVVLLAMVVIDTGFKAVPFAVGGILVLIGYFMPSIVADARQHNFQKDILFFNIIFGWTGLGWLGCMIWAVNNDISPPDRVAR